MSRKDPRKVLQLQVGGDLLAALHATRRPGRSLSDVLRRWLQAASTRPYRDVGAAVPGDGRVLAVQLPGALRRRLAEAAAQGAGDPAYCALQDLHAFLDRAHVAQARHVEPDPDQRRGADP